jgi:hypothetical protein
LTIPEFQNKHSDLVKTHFSGCRLREVRTQALAESARALGDLMRLLADHGPGHEHPHHAWIHGGLHAPCVHAGGILTSSQTTGSWVAELTPDGCAHWATGTAAPCVSLFKPVRVDGPVTIKSSRDQSDDSLWWRHEALHRRVMCDPARLRPLFIPERDRVQKAWLESPPESAAAFAEADALLAKWTEAVAEIECRDVRPVWARAYWGKRNRRAGLDLSRTQAASTLG